MRAPKPVVRKACQKLLRLQGASPVLRIESCMCGFVVGSIVQNNQPHHDHHDPYIDLETAHLEKPHAKQAQAHVLLLANWGFPTSSSQTCKPGVYTQGNFLPSDHSTNKRSPGWPQLQSFAAHVVRPLDGIWNKFQ